VDHGKNGSCEHCRRYAEGVYAAPMLFQASSLYNPALKRRTLTAVARSGRGGDVKLGLLLAVPMSFSLLLSFFVQVCLVNLALSKTLSSGPILWTLSIAVVTTLGAAAGFVCIAVLARKNTQRKKLQEVLCD
jgi:positive regulator of sigma E activity